MCQRCSEIDQKLGHYRELSRWVVDKLASDGIRGLIEKYEAEKRGLHPEWGDRP